MSKYGEGLAREIIKAVNRGDIIEPITYKKIEQFCSNNGLAATENQMRVILSNGTENKHSPTYTKYFERTRRGEYRILSKYRHQIKYFWLNINSEDYQWSFSNMKNGATQTFSSINEEGSKRKNENCFQNILVGDRALAYETGNKRAITAVCEVSNIYKEDEITFVEFKKIRDYENFLILKELKGSNKFNNCPVIKSHIGTLFEIDVQYYNLILTMLEERNFSTNYFVKLEEEIGESQKLSKSERKKLLENRKGVFPERFERTVFEFRRNPHVIAEVLERADGICEECRRAAPFKRASDGSPYLEVHHKIRLADGGKDTVENTIAVCPNCHRQLHFG